MSHTGHLILFWTRRNWQSGHLSWIEMYLHSFVLTLVWAQPCSTPLAAQCSPGNLCWRLKWAIAFPPPSITLENTEHLHFYFQWSCAEWDPSCCEPTCLAAMGTPRFLLQTASAFFVMYDYTAMLLCHLFDEHGALQRWAFSRKTFLLRPLVRSPLDKKSISSPAIWDFTARM